MPPLEDTLIWIGLGDWLCASFLLSFLLLKSTHFFGLSVAKHPRNTLLYAMAHRASACYSIILAEGASCMP